MVSRTLTASAASGGTSPEPIPVFECTDVTLVHREHGLYVFTMKGICSATVPPVRRRRPSRRHDI